jgi:hypothetical protein
MKHILTLIFLAGAWFVRPGIAQENLNPPAVEKESARAVRVEATIDAPVSGVWRLWTTSQGAEEFFAQKANIELAIGGPYEIQFDPKDETSGTKGLKVLSYAPEEMVHFNGTHRRNIQKYATGELGWLFKCAPKAHSGLTSP